MAFGRTTNILYLLNWSAVENNNTVLVARFCTAVVWIAELVRVKKSWKLV